MIAEFGARRFQGRWIRIHDPGDFFSDDYLAAWLRVCRARPGVHFYAYTKEVARFRRLVEPSPPPNLRWVYSYGGTQDNALDPAVDRVADVFTDDAAIAAAGWSSQNRSVLLAGLGPRLSGSLPTAYRPTLSGSPGVASANGRPRSTALARRGPAADGGTGTPQAAVSPGHLQQRRPGIAARGQPNQPNRPNHLTAPSHPTDASAHPTTQVSQWLPAAPAAPCPVGLPTYGEDFFQEPPPSIIRAQPAPA